MAYMMHVRGWLLEYSDTVKIFRPHLFRSSNSWRWKMPTDSGKTSQTWACPHTLFYSLFDGVTLDSSSSLSVLTPKRVMPLLRLGPWDTFFTPLIWVISCCCFFFFSRAFGVGCGISTSFCLSGGRNQSNIGTCSDFVHLVLIAGLKHLIQASSATAIVSFCSLNYKITNYERRSISEYLVSSL